MRPTAVRHGLLIIWRQSSLARGPGKPYAAPRLALAAFVCVLFQAPMPCGAPIRDTAAMRRARETGLPGRELHCRNNSRGLLKGCRQVQQHKWQYLKTALFPARWLALLRQLASCWQGLTNIIVAAASAITVISTAVLVTRHFA